VFSEDSVMSVTNSDSVKDSNCDQIDSLSVASSESCGEASLLWCQYLL